MAPRYTARSLGPKRMKHPDHQGRDCCASSWPRPQKKASRELRLRPDGWFCHPCHPHRSHRGINRLTPSWLRRSIFGRCELDGRPRPDYGAGGTGFMRHRDCDDHGVAAPARARAIWYGVALVRRRHLCQDIFSPANRPHLKPANRPVKTMLFRLAIRQKPHSRHNGAS